jgi:hypothetical protein
MPFYSTSDQFYSTMRALFDRLAVEPEVVRLFKDSGLIVRIQVTNPQGEIVLNGRREPVNVAFGPSNGRADLELALPADVLHGVWLGELRLRDAIDRGDIQFKGAVWKALQLAPLFRRAEALYPEVLETQGFQIAKN